jgi:hypothetical protein
MNTEVRLAASRPKDVEERSGLDRVSPYQAGQPASQFND